MGRRIFLRTMARGQCPVGKAVLDRDGNAVQNLQNAERVARLAPPGLVRGRSGRSWEALVGDRPKAPGFRRGEEVTSVSRCQDNAHDPKDATDRTVASFSRMEAVSSGIV